MAMDSELDSSGGFTDDYYGGLPPQQQSPSWQLPLPPGATRDPVTGAVSYPPGTPSPFNMGNYTQIPTPNGGNTETYVPNQAAQTPNTNTGGQSGGMDQSGGQNNGQGLFNPALYAPFQGQAPQYQPVQLPNAPEFQAPNYRTPPAFSYQDFKAPTLEEAQNQPGYQFGLQQGEQALQQSRAAQGLLRTGGTLKDILDYGRNAATQNYAGVLNQNLGVYNTNRQGAVQAYNTNYQTQYQDPNNQSYQTARDALAQANLGYGTNAAAAQHTADASNNRDWDAYVNSQNLFFNNQNSSFGKYLSLAQLGAANA